MVSHPRYLTVPGLARCADGWMLFLQTVAHVGRIRHAFPFDVIDAHYAFPDGMAAVLLAKRFGVPATITIRGGDIDLLPRFQLRRRAIRWTLRRAAGIFSVSEHLATAATRLGAPAERIEVVPNGIDTRTFFKNDQATARAQLGLSSDSLLVCVGNLIPEKGQHLLLDAVHELARRGLEVRAVLIGTDPSPSQSYRRRLERRATELGIAQRFVLAGGRPQSELGVWYGAADLLVLPTFREGCPNVVREALACGLPAVASDVGGVPELIRSESTGILVRPGEVGDLVEAIVAGLQRSWDRAGIASASGSRTWADVGHDVAGRLRRIAAGGADGESRTPPSSDGATAP